MDRKKFGASLVALIAGLVLSAGSVWAHGFASPTGYLMGDPAPGKLVPYFKAKGSLATIIGIENLEEDATLFPTSDPFNPFGEDILVHVTVFSTTSVELINFDLCLSPYDFGYIVLQEGPITAAQLDDLDHVTGPHTTRFGKARVLSMGGLATEGYVTIRALAEANSDDGTCGAGLDVPFEEGFFRGEPEPLATWAILQDIVGNFFATEIPTPTANVVGGIAEFPDFGIKGRAFGGFGAFGLIPGPPKCGPLDVLTPAQGGTGKCVGKKAGDALPRTVGHTVIARYDVNPFVKSHTDIFVWLQNTGSSSTWPASLQCEDELSISTVIDLSKEVNVIDPDALGGGHALDQCKLSGQFRGVMQFFMPDTGFLWSHISQDGANFRENFLGYNLECNEFIDPRSCD